MFLCSTSAKFRVFRTSWIKSQLNSSVYCPQSIKLLNQLVLCAREQITLMFSASNTQDNPVNSHTPHPAKNSCTACVTLLTMWLCSLASDAVHFGTCTLSHTTSRPRRPVFFFFFFFHVFRTIIFASLYGVSQYFLEYRSTRCHIKRLTRKYSCSKSTYFESLPKHQPSSLNKP